MTKMNVNDDVMEADEIEVNELEVDLIENWIEEVKDAMESHDEYDECDGMMWDHADGGIFP